MMMKTSRSTFLMGAAALTAALPRPARAETLTTLRLGTATGDDVTPIVYGLKAGIFAKYGLDLQLQRMVGATAAGMLGGSFELSKSVISTLLDAHVKNLPITLVAAASVTNLKAPYVGFLLKKDSPSANGKDFNNQVIGLGQLGDTTQVALLKWIDEHGGDYKSLKFIDVPTTAAPAAVDTGRVYASESTQPAIAAAMATGKMKLVPVMDVLGAGALITAWATTVEFSTKHPDLISAFAHAYKEAVTYTNVHHAETVDMMSTFSSVPAEIIATMPRATAAPTLTAAQIQPVIDASVKYGLLARSFPAVDMIDPRVR
jgi:NitT/TauT family transport system substrate-binding protein